MSGNRFDRIQKSLFHELDDTNIKLFKGDIQAKERIEKIFTYWVNNPHLADRKIIAFTMHFCGLKKIAAYDYLTMVKQMVGSVWTASKEWYRHMVIEMSKAAYQMAVAKRDPKSMALPAVFHALQRLGYPRDVHIVVGKKPPAKLMLCQRYFSQPKS